ncbi:MAG: hypothetical protein LC772_09805, partial [Chloroflexi bacterium]|nr:hypothetical protein [Chloroflexota bacterium]
MRRPFLTSPTAPVRVRAFSQAVIPLVVLLGGLGIGPAGVSPARAAGPMGVDTGWVVDNSGNPLFTSSKA